uniref:Ig-like domain-containing protein n=1 Tax=Pygocentrus nattereri TaxID=42514 RepID=A0AAR2LSQ3_PYGNA
MLPFSWLGCKIIFSFISGGVYSIDPLETEKQVSVGDRVSLSCRYSTSNVYFYWYRQYPSSKLDLLLYMHERGSVKKNKTVNLIISSAEVSDSALYYCKHTGCTGEFIDFKLL